MEMIAVYDEEGNQTGVCSREEAHRRGLWHRVVHCWMYARESGQNWLYFQKRAKTKKDFPGLYDLASAGHMDLEESHQEAVIRETEEELGISMIPEHLQYLGEIKEEIKKEGFIDREIAHVYLCRIDLPFFDPGDEVDQVIAVSKEEFEKKEMENVPYIQGFTLEGEPIILHGEEWCGHAGEYLLLVMKGLEIN